MANESIWTMSTNPVKRCTSEGTRLEMIYLGRFFLCCTDDSEVCIFADTDVSLFTIFACGEKRTSSLGALLATLAFICHTTNSAKVETTLPGSFLF